MKKHLFVSQKGLELLRSKINEAQKDLWQIRNEKAIAYTASGDQWHDNPYFNKLEQDERAILKKVTELYPPQNKIGDF